VKTFFGFYGIGNKILRSRLHIGFNMLRVAKPSRCSWQKISYPTVFAICHGVVTTCYFFWLCFRI